MGYYLSQVRFLKCQKLYWFRSDQCPQTGCECLAWSRGKQTPCKIVKTCYAQNERAAMDITDIPFSHIAPLISYPTQHHSDSVLVPIAHINVPPRFYEHFPRPEKLMEKYQKIVFEGINLPIVVERSTGFLKDGFAAYLIYVMMRRDQVPVVYVTSVEK